MLTKLLSNTASLAAASGYGNHSVGMLLASLAFANPAKNILQIGYSLGYSAVWLCAGQRMNQEGRVISVEINPCDGGEIVSKLGFNNHRFIHSNSRDALEAVKQLMPQVDLLFIDGDHTYEGCKADWDLYSPLVTSKGVVLIHDNYDVGIQKAINEIDQSAWNFSDVGGTITLVRRLA